MNPTRPPERDIISLPYVRSDDTSRCAHHGNVYQYIRAVDCQVEHSRYLHANLRDGVEISRIKGDGAPMISLLSLSLFPFFYR